LDANSQIVCSRSMSKWILWSAAVTDGALI
jgi:hypothetical protein